MKKELIKSKVSKSEFAKICDLIKDWEDLTLSIINDNIMGLEENIQKLERDKEKINQGIELEIHYIEKERRIQVEKIHQLEEEIRNLRIETMDFNENLKKEHIPRLDQISNDLDIQKQNYILCFDEVENCQKRSVKYEKQLNSEIEELQFKIIVFHKIKDTFIELWPESPRQPTSPRAKLEASPLRRPNSFKKFLKTSPAFKSFPSGSVSLPASPRRQTEPISPSPKMKAKNNLRRKCYSPLNTPMNSPMNSPSIRKK